MESMKCYALIPVPYGLTFERELQAALRRLHHRDVYYDWDRARIPRDQYGLLVQFYTTEVDRPSFRVLVENILLGMYENGGDTSDYRFRVSHVGPPALRISITQTPTLTDYFSL